MRGLLGRCGGVLLCCDDQDELPYEIAAEYAGTQRRHAVIVETPREAIEEWTEFAHGCGVVPENLTAFIADPEMANVYRDMDVADIPPSPRRPVH
jgi:hypothetical protein